MIEPHGGNIELVARRLACRPSMILDSSASLVPFGLPFNARLALFTFDCQPYPDRSLIGLSSALAAQHRIDPVYVLPGNGAAELFTWAARDAAAAGVSWLLEPGFHDYQRALRCWDGEWRTRALDLSWSSSWPSPFPELPSACERSALWITNPHNPTGHLWSRSSLARLLERFELVICDEAFLPLVPDGESQSMVRWVPHYPNLIVIRSLTKLYGIAGLRLGYAVAQPDRLHRWSRWRDPWPVNSAATAVVHSLLRHPDRHQAWIRRVQRWSACEGAWLSHQLSLLPGIRPMPSAANYLLIRGESGGGPWSLQPLREALEIHHRILLRDCRSFEGLDETWLRIGYQNRRGNRRIIRAMRQELSSLSNPASN